MQLCGSLPFFGIAFLWDWNENWLFPVLWPLLNISLVINSVSPVSILCRLWNDISLKPRHFKTGRNLGTALAYLPFSIEKETEVSSRAQAWKWQATPVLLPVKSHGWRSLVGYSPWGSKNQAWLSDFTSLSLSLLRLSCHFSCIHSSFIHHVSFSRTFGLSQQPCCGFLLCKPLKF